MNILAEIVEQKQREIAALPLRPADEAALRWALQAHGPRRDFARALKYPATAWPALIAEVKKASPSAGLIRPDFDPVTIARAYEDAGASCLSVLTDEKYFQGSLPFLRQIRAAVRLPLLRKDFILEERQILESIEWGADAILLIVAILDDARLEALLKLATSVGLAVLVEVHDEAELRRAWQAGARLIGINNRDLRTFKTDLATTERLAVTLRSFGRKGETLLVAESGIHSRADAERLARAGAQAMLVGESLMRHSDLSAKVRELTTPS